MKIGDGVDDGVSTRVVDGESEVMDNEDEDSGSAEEIADENVD